MNKGIGLSRTVTLEWLDATASLVLENRAPREIRQELVSIIQRSLHGVEMQRKTIDVLLAIWVKTANTIPVLHKEALRLYKLTTVPEERLWLHYGMTLAYYPFFRLCALAIGQLGKSDEIITNKMVKERVAAEMGHLGDLDRSVERLIASLVYWGIIKRVEQKNKYKICLRTYHTSITDIETWLLSCALHAHPAEELPFTDLLRLPELFPFKFTITLDHLRKSPHLVVQRQGSWEMIRLKD